MTLLEESVTRHAGCRVAASNLFFQGNENEVQTVVHSHSAKQDDNHSSASISAHDEDQKYWLQFTEEYDDI